MLVHLLAQRSPPETSTVSVLLKLAQDVFSAQTEVLRSGHEIEEVIGKSSFKCREIFCKHTKMNREDLGVCLVLMVMVILAWS